MSLLRKFHLVEFYVASVFIPLNFTLKLHMILFRKESNMEQNNYINDHNIGNYITPAIWASEGHTLISACLGADWKEKYLVWDCCCGQENLTCGYTFAELYSSTKDARDITSCRRYHRKANSFTYDFLEDDITLFDALLTKTKTGYTLRVSDFYCSKLYRSAPGLIMALLDKKPIVFWINPPYGTAGNQRKGEAKHSGAAKTAVNTLMLRASMGSCSQQLYAQFLFRIGMIKELFGLPECHIALYSTPAL